MRTSLSQQIQSSLMFTGQASQKLIDAQNQAVSGKRIQKPSDDVPGTNRALTLRSGINTVNQFANNVTVSTPLLNATENAMSQLTRLVNKINTLAIGAANADFTNGEAATTYVSELNGYMQELVDLANTKHQDQFLFSGTATSTMSVQINPGPVPDPAVQPYIYSGNSGTRYAQVLSWVSLPVNIPGDKIFNFDTGGGQPAGAGTTDLFSMIKNLKDAIQSGSGDAVRAQFSNIEKNFNNVLSCQAQIGSWQGRMDSAKTSLADTRDRFKEMLSDTEDVDLPEAIVQLKSQENVYQTALSISSRMLDLSLASINR